MSRFTITVLFLRRGNPQIRSQRVLRPIPRVPQSDNYEGDDNPKDQENTVSPVPQHLEMFRRLREGRNWIRALRDTKSSKMRRRPQQHFPEGRAKFSRFAHLLKWSTILRLGK
jgi:hypothetical protein